MDLNNFISKKIKKYSYDINKGVSIDPYNFENALIFEKNKIKLKEKSDEVSKEYLVSSYLPFNLFITYELHIPKNLLEKIDLNDYIETKCYEELDLDEAEKYIFKFKELTTIVNDKESIFQIIIIEEKALKDYFSPLISTYDYIDYLAFPGLLFEVLYKEEILAPKKDVFIYLKKDSILIALYNEGEFLESLVINEGLVNVFEKLVKTLSIPKEKFNYDKFVQLLTKKGLILKNYEFKEEIVFNEMSEIFSNLFMLIINQFSNLQRKYSLPTIDRIYVSTEVGIVPGMSEFTSVYLGGTETKDLKFDNEKYNPNKIVVDQLLFLSILTARYSYREDYQDFNFTLKKRPPTFFYRKSGQLISITIASLIVSSIYPLYEYGYSLFIDNQNQLLQEKLDKLKGKSNHLHSIVKNKKKSVEKQKALIKLKENKLTSLKRVIEILYKEKKGFTPFSLLLTKISLYMKKDLIYVNNIEMKDGILKLDLIAKKDSYITNFVNDLTNNEKLIIETDGIEKNDKNSQIGNSKLKKHKEYYVSTINIKVYQ